MLSRKGLTERINTGLYLETQGVATEQVAILLGYANEASWALAKRTFAERNNGVTVHRLCNKSARIARFQKGIMLEAQGMTDIAIAKELGFVSTGSWREEKRKLGAECADRTAIQSGRIVTDDITPDMVTPAGMMDDSITVGVYTSGDSMINIRTAHGSLNVPRKDALRMVADVLVLLNK